MRAALAAMLLGVAPSVASAQTAAYWFATAPLSLDTQLSLGFAFMPVVDITVNSLGYYDDLGDGFLTAHEVGIFLGDGMLGPGPLLASTTLAAGTSGVLGADDFRYNPIAPITLFGGTTYTIAGLSPNTWYTNDLFVAGGPSTYTGFGVDPRITIGPNAARFTYYPGGTLTDPASHFSDYQFYAVDFGIASDVAPEPATITLFAIGLVGLLAAGRRRRRA